MHMYQSINFAFIATLFRLEFGTVLTVWYFPPFFFQNSIFNVSYDMSRVVEVAEFSHPLKLTDTWSDVSPENSIYLALNTITLTVPTINCGSHDIAKNG